MRIKKVSLVDAVMEQMLEAVSSGRFKPGSKIPSEKQLVQEFGVSRTTLREAFKRLEMAGTLHIRQGDGTYIIDNEATVSDNIIDEANFTLSDEAQEQISRVFSIGQYTLSSYVEARELIEANVIELAIERATEEDLERLRVNLAAQKTALNNPEVFYQLDCAFHYYLVAMTQNKLLTKFWTQLLPMMRKQVGIASAMMGVSANAYDYHCMIYEAIKSRDIELAKQHLTEHIRIVSGRVLFGGNGDIKA